MATGFDLDAYLDRIGYEGGRTATLETFQCVHRRHSMTFPFENINTLMGWPVPLDIASLQAKMVGSRRGGYCFEQNLLLKHALEALGFRVTGLAARVLANRPPDSHPPRTHMLLRVEVGDDSYVADGGFGGMTLTEPIRLEEDTVQRTSHEPRRLLREDDEFIMQAQVQDEWRTLYRFNLAANHLSDYELSNWYICTHPESHFRRDLTAARPTPHGRYALRNNDFAVHDLEGNTERTLLTSAAEIRATLEEYFLLQAPESPELDERLESLVERADA